MRKVEDKEVAAALARLSRSPDGAVLLRVLEEEHDDLVKSFKSANTVEAVFRIQGELRRNDDLREAIATAPEVWSRLSNQKGR